MSPFFCGCATGSGNLMGTFGPYSQRYKSSQFWTKETLIVHTHPFPQNMHFPSENLSVKKKIPFNLGPILTGKYMKTFSCFFRLFFISFTKKMTLTAQLAWEKAKYFSKYFLFRLVVKIRFYAQRVFPVWTHFTTLQSQNTLMCYKSQAWPGLRCSSKIKFINWQHSPKFAL